MTSQRMLFVVSYVAALLVSYVCGYSNAKSTALSWQPHIINCYDVQVRSHMEGVDSGLRMCRDFIDAHRHDGGYNFQTGELVK